jgi:hypothetical protein
MTNTLSGTTQMMEQLLALIHARFGERAELLIGASGKYVRLELVHTVRTGGDDRFFVLMLTESHCLEIALNAMWERLTKIPK